MRGAPRARSDKTPIHTRARVRAYTHVTVNITNSREASPSLLAWTNRRDSSSRGIKYTKREKPLLRARPRTACNALPCLYICVHTRAFLLCTRLRLSRSPGPQQRQILRSVDRGRDRRGGRTDRCPGRRRHLRARHRVDLHVRARLRAAGTRTQDMPGRRQLVARGRALLRIHTHTHLLQQQQQQQHAQIIHNSRIESPLFIPAQRAVCIQKTISSKKVSARPEPRDIEIKPSRDCSSAICKVSIPIVSFDFCAIFSPFCTRDHVDATHLYIHTDVDTQTSAMSRIRNFVISLAHRRNDRNNALVYVRTDGNSVQIRSLGERERERSMREIRGGINPAAASAFSECTIAQRCADAREARIIYIAAYLLCSCARTARRIVLSSSSAACAAAARGRANNILTLRYRPNNRKCAVHIQHTHGKREIAQPPWLTSRASDGQFALQRAKNCFVFLNVAAGKAPMQSSKADSGIPQLAVDASSAQAYNPQTCTLTLPEEKPWWYVNLLEPYMVQLVRLDFGKSCCGDGVPGTIVVRVGNNRPDLGTNPVCNRFTGPLEEGSPLFLPCNPPMPGAFVSVHLESTKPKQPVQLSLCEAFVYTDQALPIERCPQFRDQPPGSTATYNGKCYIFYNRQPRNFRDALDFCRDRGGSLVDESNPALQGFISWELWRRHRSDTSSQYWMGAVRDPKDRSVWRWTGSGDEISVSFWSIPQGTEQDCARYDGSRGWLWSDTPCNARLNYICQHQPRACGRPEQPPNSTMTVVSPNGGNKSLLDSSRHYQVGTNVEYSCDTGSLLIGPSTRTCLDTGFYNEFPPVCKSIECGYPANIKHGGYTLINDTVTYLSQVLYSCEEGFEMTAIFWYTNSRVYYYPGRARLTCDIDERWNGPPPRCEPIRCDAPAVVPHASVAIEEIDIEDISSGGKSTSASLPSNGQAGKSLFVGSIVTYTCDKGYKLIGNRQLLCLTSGSYDRAAPSCIGVCRGGGGSFASVGGGASGGVLNSNSAAAAAAAMASRHCANGGGEAVPSRWYTLLALPFPDQHLGRRDLTSARRPNDHPYSYCFNSSKHYRHRASPDCNTVASFDSGSSGSRGGLNPNNSSLNRYYHQAWENLHESTGQKMPVGGGSSILVGPPMSSRRRETLDDGGQQNNSSSVERDGSELVVNDAYASKNVNGDKKRHHHHHHHHYPINRDHQAHF
ncbi:unnamed protein product [Trichogramma brassicae]|uniref:Sushi, von Willebrand factor type A, EGF and pentraxin domain-containing protein 1 n=1 Tax=Trichogramma brassicae TaxID=86971 RepID=A0A6H5IPQ4_9HYME|nr:unnamed protein product [Trichogramma brassicae]